MTQYDNTNRGILFKNNKKQKESQPDFTGKINVNGEDFELSAWAKLGKAGQFYSLSVKPPFKKEETHKGFNRQGDIPERDDMDSPLPF